MSDRFHICFLSHEYPFLDSPHGGIGTFLQIIARALVDKGHRVSVIGISYHGADSTESDKGVIIYRLKVNKVRGFSWWLNKRRLNKKIKDVHRVNPIDIVEATETGLAFLRKITGMRYIIRLHGGHHFFAESEKRKINPWKGFQEKRSFRKADRIVGVSQFVLNHTGRYIDFRHLKTSVVYNPADLDKFYEAREEKKISGRIFFAGTICEKKGIRELILAMPLIRKRCRAAHLWIAGRDWKFRDGRSYTAFLKQFITDDIKEHITFLGSVSHDKMPSLIEEAEVCVYPSYMEAMPMAWIEAMCMGTAFVGSNRGPAPELIVDKFNGLMCDPLSPQDIADKTISILNNKDFRQSLGINAKLDIRRRFDTEKIVEENIRLYGQIIRDHNLEA